MYAIHAIKDQKTGGTGASPATSIQMSHALRSGPPDVVMAARSSDHYNDKATAPAPTALLYCTIPGRARMRRKFGHSDRADHRLVVGCLTERHATRCRHQHNISTQLIPRELTNQPRTNKPNV